MAKNMSELPKKRLAAAYEVQVKIDGKWRVANIVADREEAVLEAVALTGEHDGARPVRVMGELNDALTRSTRPSVVWSHKPPPRLPPADAFEQKRELRLGARKSLLSARPALFGLGGVLLLGLLALSLYVGIHIHMANVRY